MPAPIPDNIVRTRLVFNLTQGANIVDQAVMGFHLELKRNGVSTIDWQARTEEVASKTWQKWTERVTSTAVYPGNVKLAKVEAYHLDNAGKTLNKGQQGQDGTHNAWAGTANSQSLPLEVSCAVSLYGYPVGAFAANSRRKRGRFYLPPFAATQLANSPKEGMFLDAGITSVSTDITAFLNDIQGMSSGGGTPGTDSWNLVILSRAGGSTTQVSAIRVGHRPDRQSRRGKKLPETYVDTSITVD